MNLNEILKKYHVCVLIIFALIAIVTTIILMQSPNNYGWVSFHCDNGVATTVHNHRHNITINSAYKIVYSGENSGCVVTNAW